MNRNRLKTAAALLPFAAALLYAGAVYSLSPSAASAIPNDTRWIPLPVAASDFAEPIDNLFYLILWITGVAFVLVEVLLVAFLIKFRYKKGRQVHFSHGNNTLEIIWTVVPALILIFIGIKSQGQWDKMRNHFPTAEPVIEVVAQQFNWKIRYAGTDGRLGRTDSKFVSNDNTFALDPMDAHGADDLFMDGTILLRKDVDVRIRIRSKDVIHSFFVPVFRFKQDAVPGMPVDIHVRPILANLHYEGDTPKIGPVWQIACAELCGNSHTNMKGNVYVTETEADYQHALADMATKLWEATPQVVPEDFFKDAKLPEADAASTPAAAIGTKTAAIPASFTAGGAGGEISGGINFTGDAPAPAKIAMAGDAFCAGANEGQMSEEYAVKDGKLGNVFVYLKEGVEGKPIPPADNKPVVFDQRGCWYSPHVVGLRVGQPFEIRNSDATLHNVHGLGNSTDLQFNNAMPAGAAPTTKVFTQEEIGAKIKCDVHSWMGAWAGVVNHPWFAVSDAGGHFTIKGVPPGEYTLHAWHEKMGEQTVRVTVSAAAGGQVTFTFAKK